MSDTPALIIGDQSEIALEWYGPPTQLDYRMALLGQPGDIVIVNRRDTSFEAYLAQFLGRQGIRFIEARRARPRSSTPVSVLCRKDKDLRSLIGSEALKAGGLLLLPYLTTGHTWILAQRIAADTGCHVSVCGPSPRISRRVNDKIWFTNRVREVPGPHAAPPAFAAYGPAAAAGHIVRFSKKSSLVVVKVPDSAGSAGNVVFESGAIAKLTVSQVQGRVVSLLHARGWRDTYLILVGVWDCNAVSSSSVQMWIPLPEAGAPVIEGVFEQRLEGEVGTFVGAVPATLPEGLHRRIVEEAVRLAFLFQRLGYFGRCSIDSIVVRDFRGDFQVHWIECNGRWGGVSIPMTLANHLCKERCPDGLVIVQKSEMRLSIHSTEEALETLNSLLFNDGACASGVVLLSPLGGEDEGRINFMAIGDTQFAAERLAIETVERLSH
jgi:hypothetical protein